MGAARAEYEEVMRGWEKDTDKWRQEIISSCEKSLDVARKEVVRVREEREAYKKQASHTKEELAALQTELGELRAMLKASQASALEESKLKEKYQKEARALAGKSQGTTGLGTAPGHVPTQPAQRSGTADDDQHGMAKTKPPLHGVSGARSTEPRGLDLDGIQGAGMPPTQPSPAALAAMAARSHARKIGFEQSDSIDGIDAPPSDNQARHSGDERAETDSVESLSPSTPKQVPP